MRMVYLSELQNVRPRFTKDFDFGHGVKIVKMNSSMRDLADHALGCRLRFWRDRWAIFAKEPILSSQFIDGDPSGAVRVLVYALLLCLGHTVRLGPLIHLQQKSANNYKISACLLSGIHLDRPWPHDQVKLSIADTKKIKSVFEKLITNNKADLIVIPFSFYERACEVNAIPYEAILIGVIGMEALFLKNEHDKAKNLAKRCATFLSSKIGVNYNDIHREIFSIYKIRNRIVHDGCSYPKIQVTDESSNTLTLDCATARNITLKYLRHSLVAVLDMVPKNKQDFLRKIRNIQPLPHNINYKVKTM